MVDLQDIGTRTWTYVGSVVYAMRAAARNHPPIVVPDRPNPLANFHADGPLLDVSNWRREWWFDETGLAWVRSSPNPDAFVVNARSFDERYGRPGTRAATLRGDDPDDVVRWVAEGVAEWQRKVARFRLYE